MEEIKDNLIELLKVCPVCGVEFPATTEFFFKSKDGLFGVRAVCKTCTSIYRKTIYNPEKGKEYREVNIEKRKVYQKQYYKKNPEKYKLRAKNWGIANPEKRKKYRAKWAINNSEKRRNNYNQRMKTDPKFNLRHKISNAIYKSLKSGKQGASWEKILKYTINDLKSHIQKQFSEGMSWELFLEGKIHLDHKIPVSVFNFTKISHQDFRKCWALSNLQPMWALENCAKGAKLTKHFQPSLLLE